MRVADELRGNSASLRAAANRSSVGNFLSRAIALSLARRLAYCFAILRRRSFFSIELFFAIRFSPYGSAFEALDPHCRNGQLNAVSSARASSSLRAVVQTVLSRPQVSTTLSKSISGNTVYSLMPSE